MGCDGRQGGRAAYAARPVPRRCAGGNGVQALALPGVFAHLINPQAFEAVRVVDGVVI